MAGKPDRETMKLLAQHLKYIKKEFKPDKIVLFGSRARGDNLITSDIDLLVVSKKFEGVDWRKRMIGVFGDWDKKQMLEAICYTPEEFERKKKQIGIVKQAVKEGIEIN